MNPESACLQAERSKGRPKKDAPDFEKDEVDDVSKKTSARAKRKSARKEAAAAEAAAAAAAVVDVLLVPANGLSVSEVRRRRLLFFAFGCF